MSRLEIWVTESSRGERGPVTEKMDVFVDFWKGVPGACYRRVNTAKPPFQCTMLQDKTGSPRRHKI